jgi:hypothetical protein
VIFTQALQRMVPLLKFLALGFVLAVSVSFKEDFLYFWTFFFFGGGAILDVDGEATLGGSDVDLFLCNGNTSPLDLVLDAGGAFLSLCSSSGCHVTMKLWLLR